MADLGFGIEDTQQSDVKGYMVRPPPLSPSPAPAIKANL